MLPHRLKASLAGLAALAAWLAAVILITGYWSRGDRSRLHMVLLSSRRAHTTQSLQDFIVASSSSEKSADAEQAGEIHKERFVEHKVEGVPQPGDLTSGLLRAGTGTQQQGWEVSGGHFDQAAKDPLNGKALLVRDAKHPGYVLLSADARLRLAQYQEWLKEHPRSTWSLSTRWQRLLDQDDAETPPVSSGTAKLEDLGVNV